MTVNLWMVKMESIHLQEKSLDDVMERMDIYLEVIYYKAATRRLHVLSCSSKYKSTLFA